MLTLEEIENISFRRNGLGGYRTDDVDTFVDGVILKVKELQSANKELEGRIEQLNSQIKLFNERQESIQDAIITAEMTSKSLVRDATHKAEVLVTDATTKADNIVKEATEKAENLLSEANKKADTVVNNAVSQSAKKVDENNRILENQKKLITQIQNEVSRFKDALIQSYTSHLKIIDSLPKADEFKAYQNKLDEYYPTSSNTAESKKTENEKAEKKADKVQEKKTSENDEKENPVDINNSVIEEKEEVIFSSSKNEKEYKAEKNNHHEAEDDSEVAELPEINTSGNRREPIMIVESSVKKSDGKFGVLKLDDTMNTDNKK